jgi:hypothetical protein
MTKMLSDLVPGELYKTNACVLRFLFETGTLQNRRYHCEIIAKKGTDYKYRFGVNGAIYSIEDKEVETID